MGKTAQDQQTLGQTDMGKETQGNDRHTLWRRRVGAPAKTAPPHPHAPRSPSRSQKAKAPLGARPGTALATAVKAAGPEDRCGEGRTGQLQEAPSRPLRLPARRAAAGACQAGAVRVLPRALPARAPQSRGRPPARPLGGAAAGGRARAASHDGAAVAAQRALEAQGGVHVLAAGAADALEQLAEEQQDVPVVLGRALHVAALPGLAHQV